MNKSSVQRTRNTISLPQLREAKWFAFDLDDTLHSFRKASATATKAVLEAIQTHSGHPLEELENVYKRILIQGTASAFVDGKTSHQYREARFQQLIHARGIELEHGEMKVLVDMYETVLMANLERKAGVMELFQTLKHHGCKIAVVTEGPQDAQERTIDTLGITPYVDYLATTNKLRVAKVDGLFVKVLEYLRLDPREMVVIGDSWERDVEPAIQAGVSCIYYSLKEPEASDAVVGWITNFGELRALVEEAYEKLEA